MEWKILWNRILCCNKNIFITFSAAVFFQAYLCFWNLAWAQIYWLRKHSSVLQVENAPSSENLVLIKITVFGYMMELKISFPCSFFHQPVRSTYSGKRLYVRNKVECPPKLWALYLWTSQIRECVSPLQFFLLSTASILAIVKFFLVSLIPCKHVCRLQSISSSSTRWCVTCLIGAYI